jgi:hypothetical protein|tara:strand:+ start:1440 stop:1547 length:108 start_codon:yes stop_codon:yes gene_type:complete
MAVKEGDLKRRIRMGLLSVERPREAKDSVSKKTSI